jgi:WD40 repeat protein
MPFRAHDFVCHHSGRGEALAAVLAILLVACGNAAPTPSVSAPASPTPTGVSLRLQISEPVGQDNVETLAFAPDGKHLAVGAGDGVIAVFPLAGGPGEEPVVQKLHAGFVSGLAWSPDGSRLLTAAGDGAVRLSDPASLQPLLSVNAVPSSRPAVAWSPDGSQFALAQGRGSVRTYSAADGSPAASYPVAGVTRDLRWLPTGELAAGDDAGRVSFLSGGTTVRSFMPATAHKAVNSLSLSPHGAELAVGYDDGAIVLIDPASAKSIRELPKGRQIGTVSWSPNGKLLAVSSVAFDLRLLDGQGQQLAREDVGYDVNGTAWSANGSLVAAAADDHSFKIWQVTPPQTPASPGPTPPSFMGR